MSRAVCLLFLKAELLLLFGVLVQKSPPNWDPVCEPNWERWAPLFIIFKKNIKYIYIYLLNVFAAVLHGVTLQL